MAESRDGMKNWHHLTMFQTMCNQGYGTPAILQMNGDGNVSFKKWLGFPVDDESELQDVDSLVIYNSDEFKIYSGATETPMYNSGIIIDTWMEFIPYKKHSAGMAFYCDRPDNEAPQALLMAVHPTSNKTPNNRWAPDDVTELLDSTRFMMMNRAVEPDHIYQNEKLSQLFPLLNSIKLKKERKRMDNWMLVKDAAPNTVVEPPK
jgi:hypothetical protein